ncbi:MAG: STAS domain-containing protein [Hyphomonadaceae bacterium]|nr:STAS domain-containing protein [Hyphomonadaceae bacterium]
MSGNATLRLPAVLDLAAATPLKASLAAVRGGSVEVDGADVERMGALCLQVLAAARTAWRADGRELRIVNASEALSSAAALMGGAEHLGLTA